MRYVALLRGINLGKRRVKMERLRELFEELKFARVSTFIASGNVLFETRARDTVRLEQTIERHLEAELGYPVETMIRTAAEMRVVADARPFPATDMDTEADTIHVGFWKTPAAKAEAKKLAAVRTEYDAFAVTEQEYYWLTRGRITDSVVWTLPVMKTIVLPSGTMGNLKSVGTLADLLGQ